MGRVFVKAEAMHAPQSLMFDRAGVPLIAPKPSVPLKDAKNIGGTIGRSLLTPIGAGLALTEQHRDFNSFLNSLLRQGTDFGRLGQSLGQNVGSKFARKPTPEQLEQQRQARLMQQAKDRLDRNRFYEQMQQAGQQQGQTMNMQRNAVEASLPSPLEGKPVGDATLSPDSFKRPPTGGTMAQNIPPPHGGVLNETREDNALEANINGMKISNEIKDASPDLQDKKDEEKSPFPLGGAEVFR